MSTARWRSMADSHTPWVRDEIQISRFNSRMALISSGRGRPCAVLVAPRLWKNSLMFASDGWPLKYSPTCASANSLAFTSSSSEITLVRGSLRADAEVLQPHGGDLFAVVGDERFGQLADRAQRQDDPPVGLVENLGAAAYRAESPVTMPSQPAILPKIAPPPKSRMASRKNRMVSRPNTTCSARLSFSVPMNM